jgi:hypothetical protein
MSTRPQLKPFPMCRPPAYNDLIRSCGRKMRRREFIIGLIAGVTGWPVIARAQSPAGEERREPTLTSAQRSEIWRALRRQAGKTQNPPE